jgi:hypothetical protein
MIVQYSKSQLLEYRRKIAGLEPLRTDCSIEIVDGIDVDSLLEQELRLWYLDLLDNGDVALLETTDIASTLALSTRPDGAAIIKLPDNCRRVLSIRLNGWLTDAKVLDLRSAERRLQLLRNAYARPGTADPLAVDLGNGSLLVAPADSYVASAVAIRDPGDDKFIFDEKALINLSEYAKHSICSAQSMV